MATELDAKLRELGPYTVFAPSNRALTRDVPGLDSLIAMSADTLQIILEQHIVRGRFAPSDAGDSLRLGNLQQRPLTLARLPNEELRINNQPIRTSQEAQNGVLHVIDAVLRPRPPEKTNTDEVREGTEMPEPEGDDADQGPPVN